VCVVGKMRDLILQLSKSSIYSTKPFYICNLNAALAMLGKFLEFAGVLCNLHIKWLIFAQDWWVWNGLSLLNKGLRGYTSANNFL
ncbi:hypothetical protein U4Y39_19505, partial [Escherichia coli]|nr:hypothetical protein [Escherichia coli]